MRNLLSVEKRIQHLEHHAGLADNGIQVVKMIFHGTDTEPASVHFTPVSRKARARAERLCKKHLHAFKKNWIPAEIWEAGL